MIGDPGGGGGKGVDAGEGKRYMEYLNKLIVRDDALYVVVRIMIMMALTGCLSEKALDAYRRELLQVNRKSDEGDP